MATVAVRPPAAIDLALEVLAQPQALVLVVATQSALAVGDLGVSSRRIEGPPAPILDSLVPPST